MRFVIQVVSGVFVSMLSVQALAVGTFKIDSAASKVEFLAVGKPGFLKIKGTGAQASGSVRESPEGYVGVIEVDLRPIDTGISLRNEHMHEKYLESQKFPKAILRLQRVAFDSGSAGECKFAGELEIKGVSKGVQGECNIAGQGTADVKVTASMTAVIADYPVGVPSHLGITVANTVDITVDLLAHPVDAPMKAL